MSADFKGQNILIIVERGPEVLETLSVHVVFCCCCCCLLKGEMTGWEWNPAQRFHSHSNFSVCVAALPTVWCLQSEGSPRSQSTKQHRKHDHGQSFSTSDICWASDPGVCPWSHWASGSDGFLPAITDANGCWGSKGHFNLPDSRFWVSSLNVVSWE